MLLSWEVAKRHWLPLPRCWNPPTIRNGLTVSGNTRNGRGKVIRPELHPARKSAKHGWWCVLWWGYHNEAILVTDVGQNRMMSARYFKYSKERIVTSGGLGTMGFGLPAAIGAAFGRPDRTVCAILGDSGLQMNLQELGTIMEQRNR